MTSQLVVGDGVMELTVERGLGLSSFLELHRLIGRSEVASGGRAMLGVACGLMEVVG